MHERVKGACELPRKTTLHHLVPNKQSFNNKFWKPL